MFEAVGVTAIEERVYVALLEHPRVAATELSRAADLPAGVVRQALGDLEEKGFTSRTPGKRVRFTPVPPDIVVEVLIFRRQAALDSAREAARVLSRKYPPVIDQADPSALVEVMKGREAVAQRYWQIARGTNIELATLDRPPYAVTDLSESTRLELDLLARGVRLRTIYDRAALESPGRMLHIRDWVASGEQARSAPDLPTKLVISDGRIGMIPLALSGPSVEGALIVHKSSLLEVLVSFFELLWAGAPSLPLSNPQDLGSEDGEHQLPIEDSILSLLIAGVKDASIARSLALSRTTVERRVRRLMEGLGAKTRFQAGFLLCRKSGTSRSEPSEGT